MSLLLDLKFALHLQTSKAQPFAPRFTFISPSSLKMKFFWLLLSTFSTGTSLRAVVMATSTWRCSNVSTQRRCSSKRNWMDLWDIIGHKTHFNLCYNFPSCCVKEHQMFLSVATCASQSSLETSWHFFIQKWNLEIGDLNLVSRYSCFTDLWIVWLPSPLLIFGLVRQTHWDSCREKNSFL